MQVLCVLYVHNVFLTVFNMAASCLLPFMLDTRVLMVRYGCTYVYTCSHLFVFVYILVQVWLQVCTCIIDMCALRG